MKNKVILLFFTEIILCQNISYDLSNQFGVELDNNKIIWNSDQQIDQLLIDSSSKYLNKDSILLILMISKLIQLTQKVNFLMNLVIMV